jgi:GGDEF domain-containing protein
MSSSAATTLQASRLDLGSALLYAVWAAVALAAEGAGATQLPPGAGTILAVGVALTVGLFVLLSRLPVAEQPAQPTMVTAQSLMAIVWTTLYAYFLAPSLEGAASWLIPGMYASAIALAVPSAGLATLRHLMLAAVLAFLAAPLLGLGLSEIGAVAARLGLGTVALAVCLLSFYAAAHTLERARAELQARNEELAAKVAKIRRHAERDQLTNSYSRRSILEMLGREKARSDRNGEPLCICLLDIDHFKSMNDRFGHQAGDRILSAFARRVRGALRTMDTVNASDLHERRVHRAEGPRLVATEASGPEQPADAVGGALGRVGGEEFIVVLPQTALGGALKSAERLRKAVVRRPFEGLHHVTVSIGIAEYRAGETVANLIGRADQALYAAKNAGRNRVHCATPDGGPSAIVMPDIPAAL